MRLLATGVLLATSVGCSTSVQQEARSPEQGQLQQVRVNDVTLNYVERGTGVPVVFVHGTLGDYRTWDGQMAPFAASYRAIAYSRRYHYPNAWPQEASSFSVTVHASDLTTFIQALNVGPVHLVGHSFGAFIALLVTRDHPELVRTLTLGEPPVWPLLATTPGGESLIQDQTTTAIVPAGQALHRGNDGEGVRLFLNGVLGEGGFEKLPQDIRAIVMDNVRELKGATMDSDLFPPFPCEAASSVSVPTLLLHGELSPEIFVRTQDILEQCLPNDERATIPAASHGLEMDNPAAFNEMVLGFLATH